MFVVNELLDARASLRAARERLRGGDGARWIVVRRLHGLVVLWYAVRAAQVLELGPHGDDAAQISLEQHLRLDQMQAARVMALESGDTSSPPEVPTVVLEGGELVGLFLPEPRTAAAPPAGPGVRASAPRRSRSSARGGFGSAVLEPPTAGAERGVGAPSAPAESALAETFTAHPIVQAPSTVAPRQRFNLFIGLSSAPSAGVMGGPIALSLPAEMRHFELELKIVADGFEAPAGWRHLLRVDRQQPSAARLDIPLVAPDGGDPPILSQITVIFTWRGMPCGVALRPIAVVAKGSHPHDKPGAEGQLWTRAGATLSPVQVQSATPAPDLVAYITRPDGNAASGRFAWTFSSPHPLELPAAPLVVDLGQDSAGFAQGIVAQIQQNDGTALIDETLDGYADEIAQKVPTEFWALLRAVHALVAPQGRALTLLLETAETHVPWELALVDPPLDPLRPAFLCCQVAMGRWILQQPGPPNPPPHAIDVRRMAVVTGDYASQSGWRSLPQATEEGRALRESYGALDLAATEADINRLLGAALPESGGAEAVHFACHGETDAARPQTAAIILAEGRPLNPVVFRRTRLGRGYGPFLFLNACQVGTAGESLGAFAGFAGAALNGGFRGFLAPLWAVNDDLARQFALEFYRRAFGEGGLGQPVGSTLRDLRSRYVASVDGPASATWLAYVYYGHPGLMLRRAP